MTRVALLLYGQPRFLSNESSFMSHKKFIFKYETDVFVHAWWSLDQGDYVPSSWSQMSIVPYDRDVIKTIRRLYNPAHAVYESPILFDVDETAIGVRDFLKTKDDLNNMKSHLYSIKRVGEVLKEYTGPNDYDYIVLSRFDNIISDLEDFNNLPKSGFFKMQDHPGTADQLFIFTPEYMNFLNIYDHYDEFVAEAEYGLELMKLMYFNKTFPGHVMTGINIHLTLARS